MFVWLSDGPASWLACEKLKGWTEYGNFLSNFFIPAMVIGTIDHYPFCTAFSGLVLVWGLQGRQEAKLHFPAHFSTYQDDLDLLDLTWRMPLDSLWNKGPQQHPSSELDSGWSSLAQPTFSRRLLSRHWCFSAKSALGDRPYPSLVDSSHGLAWWCWMQAFVACGLSKPTCAFWSLSQLGFVSSCPTVVRLRQLQSIWCWECSWGICWYWFTYSRETTAVVLIVRREKKKTKQKNKKV